MLGPGTLAVGWIGLVVVTAFVYHPIGGPQWIYYVVAIGLGLAFTERMRRRML